MELPQEIIDHIIDFLNWPPRREPLSEISETERLQQSSLMNCSLVCKRFTARAQRHLFRELTIQVPLDTLKKFKTFLDQEPPTRSKYDHPRHFIRTLRLFPIPAIRSRQDLDIHQLMIILLKIPALHALVIRGVRLSTWALSPAFLASVSLPKVYLLSVAFRAVEGEAMPPSVAFLRCFSQIDALEIISPKRDPQIAEEPQFSMRQSNLSTLKISHISFSGLSSNSHVIAFSVLRQVLDFSSVSSLELPLGYDRNEEESFGAIISSCVNLKTIALDAVSRTLFIQAVARGRIDFTLYRLDQLNLDRLILKRTCDFDRRFLSSDHGLTISTAIRSQSWFLDILSVLPSSVRTLEIHTQPIFIYNIDELETNIKHIRWDMLRDCLSRSIPKSRIPGLKVNIHVEIKVFDYKHLYESQGVIWSQVDDVIVDSQKAAEASLKEYDATCQFVLP